MHFLLLSLAVVAILLLASHIEHLRPQQCTKSWFAGAFAQNLSTKAIRASIQPGMGADGSHALHTTFPFQSMEGAVVSFDLRPDASFEWGPCGGKIAGFFVGPGKASDKKHSVDGFSYRLLWAGSGDAEGYVYTPVGYEAVQPEGLQKPMVARDGGAKLFKKDFKGALRRGAWNKVEMGVRLNTFDAEGKPKRDGVLMMAINCKVRFISGAIIRTNPTFSIRDFRLAVFHGGDCDATKASTLDFQNIRLWKWNW